MIDSIPARPAPPDAIEQERWNISMRRFNMLRGLWIEDAEIRLREFFAASVRDAMPAPELSRNPLKSLVGQLNVLCDEAGRVTADGVANADDLAPLLPVEFWSLAQDRQEMVLGVNECLMRVDRNADGSISYRVVYAHDVCNVKPHASPTRHTKGQPAALEELRFNHELRKWYFEVWDLSNPDSPVHRIDYVDDQGRRAPGEEGWPEAYLDSSQKPIFPYVLYHRKLGRGLFNERDGGELVYGTLTTAVLMTMWIGGFRDGAHPQRYSLDAQLSGAVTRSNGSGESGGYIVANQLAILPLVSTNEARPGQVGQFAPAMDPKTAGEAVEAFVAGLAIEWGLSPGDVTVGSSQQSGYAIVVSREGLRRQHKAQRVPAQLGDALLLATAARLHNATAGQTGGLPEDPGAYSIEYAPLRRSPAEIQAEREDVVAQVEAGLLNPVEGVMRLNPGMTREDAAAYLVEIQRQQALLKAAMAPVDQTALLQAMTAANLLELDPHSYFYNLKRAGLLSPETDPNALAEAHLQRRAGTPAPQPPGGEE